MHVQHSIHHTMMILSDFEHYFEVAYSLLYLLWLFITWLCFKNTPCWLQIMQSRF